MPGETAQSAAPCLGVIRLDYNYEADPGDIDHPYSFNCDVYDKVVPGWQDQWDGKQENYTYGADRLTEEEQKELVNTCQ